MHLCAGLLYDRPLWPSGGIGRRAGFKIRYSQECVGSSPTSATTSSQLPCEPGHGETRCGGSTDGAACKRGRMDLGPRPRNPPLGARANRGGLLSCRLSLTRRRTPTSRFAVPLRESVGASTLVTASASVSAPVPVPASVSVSASVPVSMAAFRRVPVFTTQRAATCFSISSCSSDGFSSGSLPLRLLSMSSRSSRHSGLSRRWSSRRLEAVPNAVS